jgi:D-amino peptidase
MGLQACFAGHWGVPVCFAQGDEATCREASEMFPGIVTACVKRAIARDTATGPSPAEARILTAQRVAEAVQASRDGKCRPFKVELPMTVTIRTFREDEAGKIAKRPNVERLDGYTVQCTVPRQCDILKWVTGTGLP